jgi:hypothetical protein
MRDKIVFMLGEEEIKLAERITKVNDSILLDELAAVAGCRYHFGGNGIAELRRLYKPKAFGDVVYSNIRWQGVLVETPAGLGGTKLSVDERRVRGLLWYLVALSPIIEKSAGKRVCTAMIQGWHFDAHQAAKREGEFTKNTPLVIGSEQLQPAPSVYWIGVTDDGQKVEWPNCLRSLRSTHARAAGKARDATKAQK